MIGSLIYYALYPLTRLINSVSESLRKDPSKVFVNGKEVWDSGGAPSKRLTKQQSALLDPWHSTGSTPPKHREQIEKERGKPEGGVEGAPQESREWKRMRRQEEVLKEEALRVEDTEKAVCSAERKEPELLEGKETTCPVEEKKEGIPVEEEKEDVLVAQEKEGVLQVEEEKERFPAEKEEADVQILIAKETSGEVGFLGEGRITHKQEMGKKWWDEWLVTMAPVTQPDESASAGRALDTHSSTNDSESSPETAPDMHPRAADCEALAGGRPDTHCCTDDGEALAGSGPDTHNDTNDGEGSNGGMLYTHSSTEGSEVPAGIGLDTHSLHGEFPAVLDLGTLLAETHVETWVSQAQAQAHPAPTGWHFLVGPGLADVVHCPSWQFPDMSYYPSLQKRVPFEVMWRVWEDLSESAPMQGARADTGSKFEFTVMSYNILAQDLLEANQELYMHCPEEVLAWDTRLHSLLLELQTWEPDIMCLQEVQENHFIEQLQLILTDMGYTCVYKRRTGTKTDGCAVCYRGERFSRLSLSLLELRRPECELLDRDNVAVVLLLQPKVKGSRVGPVCVANTHLLFNPGQGDVKLAQLAVVLAEVDRVAGRGGGGGGRCDVVLCGDFNSVPHMPLYQLITTGQLYYHGLPAWMISGQEDMSYKAHHRRLYAPLWPGSLGINDNCQYSAITESETKQSGKLQYNHDFLLQLRYCEAACVRPSDLELIPEVTDNTPDPEEKWTYAPRFRNTLHHSLNLRSAYGHVIAGTDRAEVTTLHSEGAATVDYIFYSASRNCSGDHREQDGGLKLLGRLALLSEADLWSMKGLPNDIFPSDHLSLLAKFQLDSSLA